MKNIALWPFSALFSVIVAACGVSGVQQRGAVGDPMHAMHAAHSGSSGADACDQCESPPHHLPQLSQRETSERYRFQVQTDPERPIAGQATLLRVLIRDTRGEPVRTLVVHHERLAHFLLINESLDDFKHLHPEDQGLLTADAREQGLFEMETVFQYGGRYLLAVDFADQGVAVHWEYNLEVSGSKAAETEWDFSRSRRQAGMEFYLNVSAEPIEDRQRLECNIKITEAGRDVVDLEPFLGVLTHLAIFSEGATSVSHLHGGGEEFAHSHFHRAIAGYRGPKVYFSHAFQRPGRYRIFAQFQRKGEVYAVPFDVEVLPKHFGFQAP